MRPLRIILFILYVAFLVSLRWYGPALIRTTERSIERMKVQNWEAARGEAEAKFSRTLQHSYLKLPPDIVSKISACTFDSILPFLQSSGCDYGYNPKTTDEKSHVQNQAACLAKVGFAARADAAMLECLKTGIPADWAMVQEVLFDEFRTRLKRRYSDDAASRAARCAAARSIPVLNKAGTDPINRQATSLATLVRRESIGRVEDLAGRCLPGPSIIR